MASFTLEIRRRTDGRHNVRIRLTHRRDTRHLATSLYVRDRDLDAAGRIKHAGILTRGEALVAECYRALDELGEAADAMTASEIAAAVRSKVTTGKAFRLDFIDWMEREASKKKPSTAATWRGAAQALQRFNGGRPLDISEITGRLLRRFDAYMKERGLEGGRATYMAKLHAAHNAAKLEYNDADRGVVNIPWSPFAGLRLEPAPRPAKRSLPPATIQRIIDYKAPPGTQVELGRDVFIISFALVGMNTADMFEAAKPVDGVLVYQRRKTRDQRADRAEMRIKIPPHIATLLDKYAGDRLLFNFSEHFKHEISFNAAVNRGLKVVGDAVGVPGLTFYAARHSWATIARSYEVGIDKYTVHEALNHADPDMRVTDIYIEKDFRPIWAANERVLALFDWTALAYDVL